jgi:hypothetical protein
MCCLLIVKVEQVEFLWQQMRSRGVTPDVGTWVLRIQALTTVGSIGVRTHNLLAEAANDQLELDPHLLRSFCSPIFFVLFQNSSFSAEVSFYEDKMCLIFTRNALRVLGGVVLEVLSTASINYIPRCQSNILGSFSCTFSWPSSL